MPSDSRPGDSATTPYGGVDRDADGSSSPGRHARCEPFSLQLAAAADRSHELDTGAADHVASCLRCQAELAQYRKLRRALASLRTRRLPADETLVDEILLTLGPGATVHPIQRITSGAKTRKAAYIGGIAAAATAGAAGALVIASRLASRHRLAS